MTLDPLAPLASIWVYLAATPLIGLTLTLFAYLSAQWLYRRSGGHALANPVAVAVLLITVLLTVSGMPYADYFAGAQFIHFLLGPATVALALPLARQWPTLRKASLPLAAGLLAGSITAALSAVAIMKLMGGSVLLQLSIAPKSATTPIAMGIGEKLGGQASLVTVFVIVTGVFGAMIAPRLFDAIGIRRHEARGFAMGITAHGIGTARAFQTSERMGAFAGLGMGLNGVMTAFVAPWVVSLLVRG